MIAKQSLYLTGDKQTVVPESSPEKRFLLARAGCEVSEKLLESYDGALVLARSEGEKVAPGVQIPGHPTHRIPTVTAKESAPAGSTEAPGATEGAKTPRGKKAPAKGKKAPAKGKKAPAKGKKAPKGEGTKTPAATYDY